MSSIDNNTKCPQCGGGMILRTAKKGTNIGKQFYGCSRFPRCKGTRIHNGEPVVEINSNSQTKASSRQLKIELNDPQRPSKETSPITEFQKNELQRLRDRLLNVSSRNRSIRLSKLEKKYAFDLALLNELNSDLPNELIEHCLKEKKEIQVLPNKTPENEELWNKLSERFNHLYRNITEIQKEKGLYDLYLGFPFIAGRPAGTETVVQAPLFLIPVHLEKVYPKKGNPTWSLKPNSDLQIVFNKTLFYALAKLCNLSINPDIFEEEVPNNLYGDTNFILWTQKLLSDYGLPVSIHKDALDQRFDKVQEFYINNLPEDFSKDGLQILQCAVLGHFPQSNSSIQRDYEDFLKMDQEELDGITCFLSEEYLNAEQEYDETLAAGSFDLSDFDQEVTETIDDRPEKENFFLLPSDSSQDRILLELSKKSTDGLVVWGPPGTGKSQTIVNIIGDCIAKGKTVLLVSQKRAALDVVFERLASKDMDSFVALVHDTKEDRKDLFRKISQICNSIMAQRNQVVDPSSAIEETTRILKNAFVAFNDEKFGIKYGKISQALCKRNVPTINLTSFWNSIDNIKLEEICLSLNALQDLEHPNIKEKILSARKDFEGLTFDGVISCVAKIDQYVESRILRDHLQVQSLFNGSYLEGELSSSSRDFKDLLVSVNAETSIFRFLNSEYRKRRKQLFSLLSQATEGIREAELIIHRELQLYFSDEWIKANFSFTEKDPEVFNRLIEIRDILLNYFDAFKALDTCRKTLSKEVLELETSLRLLSAENSKMRWSEVLKLSVYSLWERYLERKHSVISIIRSGQIETYRQRLKELLEQKTEFCIEQVKGNLRRNLVSQNGQDFARLLGGEVEKKRNVPSIRKLNEKFLANQHFQSVLPVWLVSPETVSDVFPLKKGLFDVVIFDEASQCTVENGLPAIYRGKQIIIAGDEKQLQPSRLFETRIDDSIEDEEDSHASIEPSLLTLAKKTLRYKASMLEWHYRSKHQELITFSNEVFYGGRMKIAPNVIPFIKGNKPAISWHSVTGFWVDRSNDQEAERVLKLIYDYLIVGSPKTLGVVTFNVNQKNLILDKIDAKIASDPEFAEIMAKDRARPLDEQLFVKNIENVQGDEREVVIFSVAYAPEHPGGRVKQQFGYLNKLGGENRLNVAITRAIEEIHIVSSINPEVDLNTSTSNHQGPKILQKYLCFAKAVAEGNINKAEVILKELNPNVSIRPQYGHMHFDSPFEEDVCRELELRGYVVHTQVGQSGFKIDLAVLHPQDPSKYILGIECDGAMFHSGVSIRERDVFRQRFLENRGWRIARIWSPLWRKNRIEQVNRIIQIIEAQLQEENARDHKSS